MYARPAAPAYPRPEPAGYNPSIPPDPSPEPPLPPPTPFDGRTVATFESRMAGAMADLIAKHGGLPLQAPALREVPLGENPEALRFARSLCVGDLDMVVFLTGVGTRYLAETIETEFLREDWLGALGKVVVVARGPKPSAVLREFKARIDLAVPEPNTWREILAAIDGRGPVDGLRIAVQEYGQPSPELVAGLEARGAAVTRVPVYRWALPVDLEPLRWAVRELTEGRVDVALFTAAQQAVHLMQIAVEEGLAREVTEAFARRVVVGSIGPTTSETLIGLGITPDIVPGHPKMGHLVAAAAEGWAAVGKGAR